MGFAVGFGVELGLALGEALAPGEPAAVGEGEGEGAEVVVLSGGGLSRVPGVVVGVDGAVAAEVGAGRGVAGGGVWWSTVAVPPPPPPTEPA